MLGKYFFIKLKYENSRDFINKIVDILKTNKEFRLKINLDDEHIPFNDYLFIDFVNIPKFLKHKDTENTYFQLMNNPRIDKKKIIVFSLVTYPPATNSEFIKAIQLFENKILKKYNEKFNKTYKVLKNEFKLSPKVKEVYDEYIKALKRGANKSDRIKFYLFIMVCHQYRSKINEVLFRCFLERENIEKEIIDDECIRFSSCFEFYKFTKGKI